MSGGYEGRRPTPAELDAAEAAWYAAQQGRDRISAKMNPRGLLERVLQAADAARAGQAREIPPDLRQLLERLELDARGDAVRVTVHRASLAKLCALVRGALER
jgi:hypothetical protein